MSVSSFTIGNPRGEWVSEQFTGSILLALLHSVKLILSHKASVNHFGHSHLVEVGADKDDLLHPEDGSDDEEHNHTKQLDDQ